MKLLLTPALVAFATLSARRWGSQVAGWLVGFPLTSAPVTAILVVDRGDGFAAAAALAIVLGVLSPAAFALVYCRCAARLHWPACLAVGTAGFAAATLLLSRVALPPLLAAAVTAVLLRVVLALMPAPTGMESPVRSPAWDLPARMLVATAFVLLLTGIAGRLGATLTGLLAPFPLFAAVLTVFAHVNDGPASAVAVLRGLLTGLYGFAAFFLVLGLLLVPAGPPVAFVCATLAVVATQAVALMLTRPRRAVVLTPAGRPGQNGRHEQS